MKIEYLLQDQINPKMGGTMFKSTIMMLLVLLAVPALAAEQPMFGLAGGTMIQDGAAPEPVYSGFIETPLYSLFGESFIAKANVAALYSARPYMKAQEIYAVKGHYLQGVEIGDAYLAAGPGAWVRPNNKGDDWVEFSYAATVGMRIWRITTFLYGDGVPTAGNSLFAVQLGASYRF